MSYSRYAAHCDYEPYIKKINELTEQLAAQREPGHPDDVAKFTAICNEFNVATTGDVLDNLREKLADCRNCLNALEVESKQREPAAEGEVQRFYPHAENASSCGECSR